MAEEGGDIPAEAVEAPPVAGPDDEPPAEKLHRPSVRIGETMSRTHRKSSFKRQSVDDTERVIVDRTALEAILDVSSRIQDIQRKSRPSMSTLALAHESYKDKQAKAKEARSNRMGGLKTQHRFLLENSASILNRTPEYVLEGVYDADIHIELLDSAVVDGGRNCIVLCDALLPPLKMESGRFIHQQKGKMERVYISDGATIITQGQCVGMYRIKNKAIDSKNVADDYFLVAFDVNQETENVVSGIYKTMSRVYVPALKECQAWGDLNPPNPNSVDIIKSYISLEKIHSIDSNETFIFISIEKSLYLCYVLIVSVCNSFNYF